MKKIFISFSFLDEDFALCLANYLKQLLGENNFELYCVALNNNYNSVRYGEDFSDDFLKNISECDIFIPLLSLNYKASPSAIIELGAALITKKEIMPLLLPGCSYNDLNNFYNVRNRDYYGIDNAEKIKKFFELIITKIKGTNISNVDFKDFMNEIKKIKEKYIANILEISEFSFRACSMGDFSKYQDFLKTLRKENLIECSVIVVHNNTVNLCHIYLKKGKKLPDFKKIVDSMNVKDYEISIIN